MGRLAGERARGDGVARTAGRGRLYSRFVKKELEVLEIVAKRLDGAGVTYMVSGSMALNFYAQPRMTRDIDVVVELSQKDVSRVVELFEEDFYCDAEEIREAVVRRRMFNLVHLESVVKIDFIVRKENAYRREEISRRRKLPADGYEVWVVAPEDLILSKLVWASESHSDFQLRDVRGLLHSVKQLDWPYLERWAGDLGVADLLEEVRS